eukprot:CAMPEP_0179463816 /NCGR_PEP_ID=MMETSP0799-20121207/45776_1 /TAXON_ID=46947 /ORGANISM="Geminigera cryophila, Strain CCMP2564" /LENGTH=275 /DNA_ID=CAMNT_0021267265 /DNA_START=51 /DNA_END=879 /DNA_ORIENTATION=+
MWFCALSHKCNDPGGSGATYTIVTLVVDQALPCAQAGPKDPEGDNRLGDAVEKVLSANMSIDRGALRWRWTFAVAPILTVLLCFGVALQSVPAVAERIHAESDWVRGLFVWLFQTANRAFFLHAACGFACGTLALERGQPIVPSVGRGFFSGVIAVVDIRQLPTQKGTVRERGGEKEQEQERGEQEGVKVEVLGVGVDQEDTTCSTVLSGAGRNVSAKSGREKRVEQFFDGVDAELRAQRWREHEQVVRDMQRAKELKEETQETQEMRHESDEVL